MKPGPLQEQVSWCCCHQSWKPKQIEGQKILSEGKKWVIFLFSSFQVPASVPQNEPGGLANLLPVSPAAGIEAPPKSAEKCVLQGVFFFRFFSA